MSAKLLQINLLQEKLRVCWRKPVSEQVKFTESVTSVTDWELTLSKLLVSPGSLNRAGLFFITSWHIFKLQEGVLSFYHVAPQKQKRKKRDKLGLKQYFLFFLLVCLANLNISDWMELQLTFLLKWVTNKDTNEQTETSYALLDLLEHNHYCGPVLLMAVARASNEAKCQVQPQRVIRKQNLPLY